MTTQLSLAIVYSLGVGLLILLFLMQGCSLGDDDFSDIQIIEQILKKDQEGIYGTEVVDDGGPVEIDTTGQDRTASVSLLGKQYTAMVAQTSAAGRLRIGRVIDRHVRTIHVDIVIPDSLANVVVTDSLIGRFFVVDQDSQTRVKAFRHDLERKLTFVKRINQRTGEKWSLLSLSPLAGYANPTVIRFDSLTVMTAHDTIRMGDPLDFNLREERIPRLRRGDWVYVEVKITNSSFPIDTLFGTVLIGKNSKNSPGRERFYLFPLGQYRYGRVFFIGFAQQSGFHQMAFDIMTRVTVSSNSQPYDDFLMMFPYEVTTGGGGP